MYTTCSELVVFVYWTGKSMNNLLSYCGLVDARIRASNKDLPVHKTWQLITNFKEHRLKQSFKSWSNQKVATINVVLLNRYSKTKIICRRITISDNFLHNFCKKIRKILLMGHFWSVIKSFTLVWMAMNLKFKSWNDSNKVFIPVKMDRNQHQGHLTQVIFRLLVGI